jgi:hypothetical protein
VGSILFDRAPHPREQIGAGVVGVDPVESFAQSVLGVHGSSSSIARSAAIPRRMCVFTESTEI